MNDLLTPKATHTGFAFSEHDLGVFNHSADDALEKFGKGCQIMGMTMGQFSLIDLIKSVLDRIGSSDVYIATWSAGIKDAHQVRWLLDTKLIKHVRLLTDYSYVNRQAKYAASVEELFGKENIRCSKMHAKFVLVGNDDYKVAIVSSMNLNNNRTCETFAIYEGSQVYDFYMDFVDHHFDNVRAGWDRSEAVFVRATKEFFAKHDAWEIERKNTGKPAKAGHWSQW